MDYSSIINQLLEQIRAKNAELIALKDALDSLERAQSSARQSEPMPGFRSLTTLLNQPDIFGGESQEEKPVYNASLFNAVIAILREEGPLTAKGIYDALDKRGYPFSTTGPNRFRGFSRSFNSFSKRFNFDEVSNRYSITGEMAGL